MIEHLFGGPLPPRLEPGVISEARKKYYEAVFVGENKTGDPMWGPISKAQAESERNRMFHCTICSTGDHAVYHNLIGRHHHLPETTLLNRIASAPFDE